MKLFSSDLDRLGMLSSQALRASRLVVDAGLHTGGWTRQRAIDYMLAHTAEGQHEVDRRWIATSSIRAGDVVLIDASRLAPRGTKPSARWEPPSTSRRFMTASWRRRCAADLPAREDPGLDGGVEGRQSPPDPLNACTGTHGELGVCARSGHRPRCVRKPGDFLDTAGSRWYRPATAPEHMLRA